MCTCMYSGQNTSQICQVCNYFIAELHPVIVKMFKLAFLCVIGWIYLEPKNIRYNPLELIYLTNRARIRLFKPKLPICQYVQCFLQVVCVYIEHVCTCIYIYIYEQLFLLFYYGFSLCMELAGGTLKNEMEPSMMKQFQLTV